MRAAITAMKYRPSPKLCRILGEMLGMYLLKARIPQDWEFIAPIPSSPASLRKRGFNQAQILAEEVHRSLWNPRRTSAGTALLRYSGVHEPQASLDHSARVNNAVDMFAASPEAYGKKILIVDDVLTTGATSTSAARALIKSGALAVDLLTLARSRTWQEYRRTISTRFSDPQARPKDPLPWF